MEKEKSVLRNKSIGTKVSDEEYGELEKLAEARGLTLSEWFRELVLAELIAHPAEQTILGEILALRAIVLNGFYAIGQGDGMSEEKMRTLIARADADKLQKAGERLQRKKTGQ
jgi:Ribbon-helix-helix protein, copG family